MGKDINQQTGPETEVGKTRSLALSATLMGIIILISKALGLVRDMLTASVFSMTEAGVAYEVASKLPINIFDFILGGVVTSAFIPVYNSIAVKKGKKEAVGFCQSYFNLILLITTSIAVLGVIFAPGLVSLMAPELSESTATLASELTRIMFPMVIFVGIAFCFVGFLQSEGEYNIPAIISLVSNVIMVVYLLVFSDKFGVRGLSVAMLIGWGAQAAVQIPAAVKRGFRYRLKTKLNTPEIKRAALNTIPILISTWTTPVCNLINTRIASGIEDGRAITALGYANRLYIIIVGLFSFVATNLLFPHFARAAAAGREEESDRLTRASIKTLTFIIAPISVGVGVLSDIFVSLIYERGNFTAEHSAITAEALRFYAIGMVFAAICEVLTKAFFAAEKMTIPMISAISAMVFNIAVVLIVGTRLGIWGIALMTAVSAAVNMTLNLIFAQKKGLIKITGHGVLDIAKSVFSAVAMGAVVWLISRYTSGMPRIVAFILPVLAGAAVYILLTLILRSDETVSVIKAVKKKLGGEKK